VGIIKELINSLFPTKVTDVKLLKIYFEDGSCLVIGKIGVDKEAIEFYST
jgi:hypothetical protein